MCFFQVLEIQNQPLLTALLPRKICVVYIPAASSKSERVFSAAGQIITAKRASLNLEKVEDLVIMACNSRRLEEFAIEKKER